MRIHDVTVIGAGTMGTGIATVLVEAGLTVRVIDVSAEALARCRMRVEQALARLVGKGLLAAEKRDAVLSAAVFSGQFADAAGSQLVIEAVTEDPEVKRAVLAALQEVTTPETIIATNTSALSVSDLATATGSPERFLGMHFFNPAPLLKLVELIRGEQTSDETMQAAEEFVRGIGKQPVRVRDSSGFVVNRLLIPMISEAARLLGEGVATAADIDRAMKLGANHPIGPLALADLIGLDVCLAIMQRLQSGLKSDRFAPAPLLEELVAAGKLGRKTGAGFFDYS
jgi:3-hydroxybutyryl-CoA dehydrogenase